MVATARHRRGPARVSVGRPPEAPRHQPLLHPRLRHPREPGDQRRRAQGSHALARQPHLVLQDGEEEIWKPGITASLTYFTVLMGF